MEINNVQIAINELTNVRNLCRVCLTESKMMIPLSNEAEGKSERNCKTVWDLLYKATSEEITCDERYPSQICAMCMGLLNITYEFKVQFEESQKLLSEYFGEIEPKQEELDVKTVLELVNLEPEKLAPVELIWNQGKYDLNDILIIEAAPEEKPNFSGFLNNLGKEVSASFVNGIRKVPTEKLLTNEPVTVMEVKKNEIKPKIINNEIKTCKSNENLDSNDDLCDDMDENDKKINRKISRCSVCQKVFANKKYLQRHVENIHLHQKQTFVCEICGAFLKSRSSHYHHMIKHVGKRHKCKYCEKTYFNSSNLQQHVMSVHTNERPHLCTKCGKSFSYANALDYHMRTHTGERKYKCSYCEKTFTMQCGLNRHTRIHTGHRPYKCKFCEKAFRSKGEVDCHEMIHTGYRPYHCKYCKKGFTKTFNLKMHLLGHPGNHACETCNKTFIEPEFLKIHMTNSHGYVEDYQDDGSDLGS